MLGLCLLGWCGLALCCFGIPAWKGLAATDSPTSRDAVPLARRGFTAEFGKGSGVGALAMATKPCHAGV